MKEIYLCKNQKSTNDTCKSRIKYVGLNNTIYFCGSHKKVNECWGKHD